MRTTLVILTLMSVCVACANAPLIDAAGEKHDALACGFVAVSGGNLTVAGQPYRAVGVNRHDVAGGPQATLCQHTPDAKAYASYLQKFMHTAASAGASVVRLWAFQNFAGAEGHDFTTLDQVLATAEQYGLRVILVLENNGPDCTQPLHMTKDANWLSSGYQAPYGAYALSFPDYVRGIVSHYKDSTTVAMWEILNDGTCYCEPGNCPCDPNVLATFVDTMARQIKSIDAHHLVIGGAAMQCWQGAPAAQDFAKFSRSPFVDVLDAHDYGEEANPWPTCMAHALQAARSLNKPLIIGESGICVRNVVRGQTSSNCVGTPYTAHERAHLFANKLQAASRHGVPMYLLWSLSERPALPDGYDILRGDPSLAVMRRASLDAFDH